MIFIKKVLKFIGKLIATVLILIIVVGIAYRVFNSKPVPPGKLIDVNGTKMHVRVDGETKKLPTIIIESGAHSNTDMLHWLVEGLKNETKVIRYDRNGKWFSESTNNKEISPEFYAEELHELLEKVGAKPPYILVGHSMGGPYTRIYRDLYPNEVEGLVFIDSSHSEQWKRLAQKELIPQQQTKILKLGALLSDLGILGVYNKFFSKETQDNTLPKESIERSRALTNYSGDVYRMFLKENILTNDVLERAAKSKKLESLPVLVFTANEQYNESQKERYRKNGVDPEKQLKIWFDMQKELKNLSTNSKQMIMDANHGTIITEKENADIINKEILLMSEKLEQ
ncbi:alpha/beta hydrolase [Empedobacter brevis]|uniref:alpha/beta hydrolase n=1 Tax=Empedobacter brevis TaxID=247 RepID=UPI00289B0B89|nr:alpha/beta hydrolase [Empedobacter brevis]